MPDINEMMSDLQHADAAGDTQLAQHIAGLIKQAQGGPKSLLDQAGAAIDAAGHNIPFLGDLAENAGTWAAHALNGRPVSWGQASQETAQMRANDTQKYPVTTAIAGVAGAVGSALAGGAALGEVAPGAAAAMQLKKGQTIANVARLAAGGGAAGAAQSGGEQLAAGNVAQAVPAAVEGGVAGAATAPLVAGGGRVAVAAGRRFAPNLTGATARVLSKVFGENASDLQATYADHMAATGRPPSMAELSSYKQQGVIRGLAKDSTTIADRLQQNAEQAALARSQNMQAGIRPMAPTAPTDGTVALPPQGGGGASSGEIANATTAAGDVDYAGARQHSFQIPTAEDETLGGISPADHLASQIVPLAGLKTADRVRIVNSLQDGTLSGQDAQMIRSKLNAAQGTGSSYSPAVASAIGDLDDFLQSPGNEAAHQALAAANANYAAGAQRAAGAAHGESILGATTAPNFAAEAAAKPNDNPNFSAGMASGARSKLADTAATPQGATSLAARFATDDSLYQKVVGIYGSPAAAALRRLGVAETSAAKAVAPYARAASPEGDSNTLKDAAQVAAAVATHGLGWKAYHAAKVFTGLSMPQNVQNTVARYLSDPRMTTQGINLLVRAGASAARLRQITLTAAGASGILGGDAASNSFQESSQ